MANYTQEDIRWFQARRSRRFPEQEVKESQKGMVA
jgi:hypothetical protein